VTLVDDGRGFPCATFTSPRLHPVSRNADPATKTGLKKEVIFMVVRRLGLYRSITPSSFCASRYLTNVAADKHFWIARFARTVRCACS
jgi:hypothetical protein